MAKNSDDDRSPRDVFAEWRGEVNAAVAHLVEGQHDFAACLRDIERSTERAKEQIITLFKITESSVDDVKDILRELSSIHRLCAERSGPIKTCRDVMSRIAKLEANQATREQQWKDHDRATDEMKLDIKEQRVDIRKLYIKIAAMGAGGAAAVEILIHLLPWLAKVM